MGEDTEVIFREEQNYLRHWWWLFLVWVAIVGIVAVDHARDELGWPSDRTTTGVVCELLLVGAFLAALTVLSALTTLTTDVRSDGLYVRYAPYHRSFRKVDLKHVTRCEAVSFRPIRYGGWGFGWFHILGGKAHTVSGNEGVRIDYADGTHLLIGSQEAEELAQTIQRLLDGSASLVEAGGTRTHE